MAYDDNNIFAKILRGEIPANKIYEDDDTFAFLDIMPRTTGHTLVIPKRPAVNMLDISPESLTQVMLTVRRLAPIIMRAVNADGFMIQQLNEAAAGQMVFHLHMHIVPRFDGQMMKPAASINEAPDKLAATTDLLAKAISESA